jgi:DNA-directed RNA polymerase beta subunit
MISNSEMTDTNINKDKIIDESTPFDIINDPYIETPWNIIETYFKDKHLERLVKHQLESFNNFAGYQIIKTIEMFNPVNIKSEQDFDPKSGKYSLEIFITFENFHIYRPQIHENNGATKLMFPQEARLRNFTYAASMTIDINIKYIVRTGEGLENASTFYKNLPKIHIGKLPIMLKSNICVLNQYKYVENIYTGECKFDAGGYFIINGSEKTVLGQERAAENRVYCYNVSKNNTKYSWTAEINSIPDFKCISPKKTILMISSKNNGFGHPIFVQIPRIKQPVPLFIVFRALDIISDKEICEHILLNLDNKQNKIMLESLQASIIDSNKYLTKEESIRFITSHALYTPINMDKETGARKKLEFTLDILKNDLFPHCHNIQKKIYFLGYMTNKILQANFEWIKGDDRDSYLNKRVDLTGPSLNNLFRNYFNKLVKDMEKQIIKEINTGSWRSTEDYFNIINLTNIYKIIKSTTIENGFKRALATGDFGIKHVNSNKVGVAQVLNRLTYVSSLSHLRRISTPTDKSGKLIPPRKLHNTSWAFLCPAECFDPETPILMWDGSCKLAKNIIIGDVLVDDLGNPTTVRTTCSGSKNMYDVIPDKSNFMKHRVTDNHILTLKIRGHKSIIQSNRIDRNYTHIVGYFNREELKFQEKYFVSLKEAEEFVNSFNDDDTLDITIEKYLKLNKKTKDNLVIFKTEGIHWPKKEVACSKFNLQEVGIGPYVGWQLNDKRGRFCLKDGLVVHNTPEGQSVGIVKNLSYMTHVTIHSNSLSLYEYAAPHITSVDILKPSDIFQKVKVFINGSWVGIANDPLYLYSFLKDLKYKGIINIYTSIIFDCKVQEIRLCNDSGRLTRPLLRVKDNNILITNDILNKLKKNELTWDDLFTSAKIEESVLEYIDPEEQSFSLIATKPKDLIPNPDSKQIFHYTHCEIHPSTIFGVIASCIPFPDHNQSPRNTYQSAMGKQAMGVYATNYNERMDKTAYVLNYPTRPLVDTRIMNMIKLNEIPSGCNINVAIMTHTGYNQEDSLLVNKGSIERGLFQATIYHTEKDEDKQKINGDEEIRCRPDASKTKGMKFGNYNKVNSKGVIPENTLVENRDIIISKVTPIKENRNDHTKVIKYEDQSRIYRTVEEVYIDKNYIDRNGDGYSFAKVRLRAVRRPVIGDKFCALPTQQVLTNEGWIEIKDIDISKHQVATLDANGKMCYEYPTAKYEYDHDDKMYSIKNKQLEIVCTLNHKLYVKKRSGKKYELIEAQDVMGKMVRFQKTMENVYQDIEFFELGDEKYPMDDWLKLLGMFISDGYCNNNIVYITALKERKRLYLEEIFKNINIEYKYSEDGKYRFSGIKNKDIGTELTKLSVGALNKFLPDYVWNLSQRQSILLLEGLLQGDGSSMEYKGETFDRYGTISLKLANDITRLALHCGWSGIVKISGEPTGIARKGVRNLGSRAGQEISVTQQHTYYKVSIIRKQNEPWINKKVNDSNEEKLIDYQGKVYCIEVPSSHTYYMRESNFSPCLIIGNSSRHGQKGTVGNIIPEEDMPFNKDGVRPDIIINPHAIPSRMTIGQLKETLLGKVLVELGLFGDGTSFGDLDVKTISKKLLDLGYESSGNELLYNGLTGEQLECNVFMGPVFYQRLKHMVNDKQHSRSIGPMVNLTRQPAEGRSRDGGLRFGEMERDGMISHGAARFTRGRMYDASDKYQVYVCKNCGLIASYNDQLHIHHCRTCDNRTDFAYVEIPYACKLLFQELITMNVVPRVITDH